MHILGEIQMKKKGTVSARLSPSKRVEQKNWTFVHVWRVTKIITFGNTRMDDAYDDWLVVSMYGAK